MLLAGDCTYSGIPDGQKNGCSYLQACHHGGEYALLPSTGNPTVNIPIPKADDNYRKVIYSANGITHGHPNQAIVDQHAAKGWTNPWRTDYAANGRLWVIFYSISDI